MGGRRISKGDGEVQAKVAMVRTPLFEALEGLYASVHSSLKFQSE